MLRPLAGSALLGLALFAAQCGSGSGASGPDAPQPLDPLPAGQLPTPAPPDNAVGGFAIQIPEITLQPGEEKEPCYLLPLEISGPSRFVTAGVLTTQTGLHHGNITTRPKTGDGIRKCEPGGNGSLAVEIASGGAVLFGSSTQIQSTEWQRFPAGMAYRVPDGQEIVARMHYLNASPHPITLAPRYQWFTIAEADMRQRVAPFAWMYMQFHIPPHSQLTVSGDCPLERPMYVVQTLPHMHALGTRFTLSLLGGPRDGTPVFDNDTYGRRGETDIRLYDPAIDLTQGGLGTGARFSCSWMNTFDKVIEYGTGDNEMCILFGYAYPPENTYSAAASEGVDCLTIIGSSP